MSLRAILDLLALLACSMYGTIPLFWLVVHPLVERWRESGRRAFAFIIPVWSGFIAIAFLLMWPFRSVTFMQTGLPGRLPPSSSLWDSRFTVRRSRDLIASRFPDWPNSSPTGIGSN